MNTDYDKMLEREIDQELKRLPNLTAPDALSSRVMAQITARTGNAWHRQAWDSWPAALKIASFVVLAGLFAGLCALGWQLFSAESIAAVSREAGGAFSRVGAILETCRVLLQATVLVVQKLGTGFLVACLMVAAFSYFLCIGAGTVFVRYAFSRR